MIFKFFSPSSKLWRLKLPINPRQVYAEIPCIRGFHFRGDHSLFLGQAESPAAAGAARLARTDCYLREQSSWLHSLCGGDLPPVLNQQLVHLGWACMLSSALSLHSPLLSLLTPTGAWVTSLGAAVQVPPSPKQPAGAESWTNCPKSMASVLLLAEPEMHLCCVEAVLVKWLLCNEYLLLLLNNHKKPTFLWYFLHF